MLFPPRFRLIVGLTYSGLKRCRSLIDGHSHPWLKSLWCWWVLMVFVVPGNSCCTIAFLARSWRESYRRLGQIDPISSFGPLLRLLQRHRVPERRRNAKSMRHHSRERSRSFWTGSTCQGEAAYICAVCKSEGHARGWPLQFDPQKTLGLLSGFCHSNLWLGFKTKDSRFYWGRKVNNSPRPQLLTRSL